MNLIIRPRHDAESVQTDCIIVHIIHNLNWLPIVSIKHLLGRFQFISSINILSIGLLFLISSLSLILLSEVHMIFTWESKKTKQYHYRFIDSKYWNNKLPWLSQGIWNIHCWTEDSRWRTVRLCVGYWRWPHYVREQVGI